MSIAKLSLVFICLSVIKLNSQNLDDYKLWLKYNTVEDTDLASSYSRIVRSVYVPNYSEIHKNIRTELSTALPQMLEKKLYILTQSAQQTP